LQFSDFARWQCERALDDWHQSELEWWREQLHGAETKPLAGVPSEVLSAGPEIRLPFLIPAKTADRLRQLAREENSTLFTVLLAGWRVWLGRCFDRHDFLIGSPTTLRQDEKTASMLGCMVNNVAFRNALDGQGTFREVLCGERSNVLSSLDHNTLPFELIVEDQQPSRFFGRHPLFQFMFQFDEQAGAVFAADGAGFTTDVLPVDRASYWDLELSVSSQGEGQPLQAFMGLRSDLFDAGSLSVWPEAICRMFELLAAAPDTSIGSVPLLSHAEATRLSGTLESAWPLPAGSLASLFVAQAARTPDAVAIRDAGGSVRYAALAEAVASRSALLASANVVAGDTVGVCMEPGVAAIATLLAINSRGASWLPLDPAYPQERLQHMVEDAAPKLVITDQPGIPWPVQTLAAADSGANAGGPAAVSGAAYPDAEVACILFTSGSTGVPKGSLLTQAAVLSRCLWMWEYGGFEQSDTFVQRTSLNFVDSIWEIFGPLLHGATVAVPPTEIHSDTARLADWICSASANHLVVVPALLNALLDEWQQRVSPLAMRSVITSGEAISSTLVQRFRLMLPNCQLLNTYGTSENWDITCARIDQLEPGAIVPAGWPVANTGVRILDAELRPLPPGLIGELYVSGIGANGAYLNREELTAQRFIHYSAEAGEKLFRTGDLAYWDQEGCIYLQGRADRQFKIRGIRIEPAEIEAVVNCLPGIDQSAVVLHEANKEDSVTAWMGLYVVAKRGASVRLAELREQLHACLPAAWVAADIVLVESIPRTPSGKLDVGELLAASDAVKSQRGAPATPTERQLVGIWVESLGLKDVGVNDDFFASRGNSLLATRMIARICDAFGVDLPLAALFESPTVAGLAGIIDALRWAAESPTPDDDADVEREVLRL
jgi:amino acid adenylation domain-containing protein